MEGESSRTSIARTITTPSFMQSVCGIGIVRDYYKLQKFNVMEIAKTEEPGFRKGEGRIEEKDKTEVSVVADAAERDATAATENNEDEP